MKTFLRLSFLPLDFSRAVDPPMPILIEGGMPAERGMGRGGDSDSQLLGEGACAPSNAVGPTHLLSVFPHSDLLPVGM